MALPGSPVTSKILYDYLLDDLRELNRIAREQAETFAIEKPEDCSDENCWRHGGKGSCRCDDETEGGVWSPGC